MCAISKLHIARKNHGTAVSVIVPGLHYKMAYEVLIKKLVRSLNPYCKSLDILSINYYLFFQVI